MSFVRRPLLQFAFRRLFAASLGCFAAPLCDACDYCLLGQGISPLQTQNGAGLRVAQRYTLLDSVYSGTDEVSNPGVKEKYWAADVAAFYSVNDRLLVLVNAPLRKTDGDGELTEGPNGEPEREDSTGGAGGLGDVSVLARYHLFGRHTQGSSTLVAGVIGVKLPTGSTDEHDEQGEYLDSHLQLGTGSTDALFGLSVDHAIDRFSMSGNVLIALAGDGETGHQSHQFGNSVNWDVTAKYRISPAETGETPDAWFVSFGLNGEARDHEHLGGNRVADSGGHTVYVTPGLQFVLAEKWVFEATYQYAIYHDLNETQLGEDYRIFSSATYLF